MEEKKLVHRVREWCKDTTLPILRRRFREANHRILCGGENPAKAKQGGGHGQGEQALRYYRIDLSPPCCGGAPDPDDVASDVRRLRQLHETFHDLEEEWCDPAPTSREFLLRCATKNDVYGKPSDFEDPSEKKLDHMRDTLFYTEALECNVTLSEKVKVCNS